jgi:hypothetical protein
LRSKFLQPVGSRRLRAVRFGAQGRLRVIAVLLFFLLAGALAWVTIRSDRRPGSAADASPQIRIADERGSPSAAKIEVTGVAFDVLSPLRGRTPTVDDWQRVLRVTVVGDDDSAVAEDVPAVAGSYTLGDHEIVFTPMFGLDPGRRYAVTLTLGGGRRITRIVSLPKRDVAASTIVDHVNPTSEVVPENLLRLYVHFSAPMGRKGGLDYVQLLDANGRQVKDPFLPLDAELWNGDRTRFTVFLDPGRVKRGVLPSEQMGRSLTEGQHYTLVVSREWPDAQGLPLKEEFRRAFRVGPPDERPLDPKGWRVDAPSRSTRDPLMITFPEPLDHGLLMRAIGVSTAGGATLDGDPHTHSNETRWAFTPRNVWREGDYQIVVLTILEDLAGNRIGRAFEVDRFDRADRQETESISLPFQVR